MDTLQRELQDSQSQIQQLTHQVEKSQRTINDKETLLQELKQQIGDRQRQPKAVQDRRWQKSRAPEEMFRGSAAVDANLAYFNGYGSTEVHSYDSDTREWCQLPNTAPYTHFTLVVVHHILTVVGGMYRIIADHRATDSLLSLMAKGESKKWLPYFPAMATKRYFTAAACSGHSLIVAGGTDDYDQKLATVEVLDTDTRQWSIASSLPHPFTNATVSICGERLFMLGGNDLRNDMTRSVLSCSVPDLLQSCQPQPLAELQRAPANKSIVWRDVADAPHYWSSCATLGGQLVAVGGLEADIDTNAINVYNETTDSWEAMGDMPTARRLSLVAILDGKMMVVGGLVGGMDGGLDRWVHVGFFADNLKTGVVEMLC